MKFSNSYAHLDEVFYQRIRPTPVRDPRLLLWNARLAEQLMAPDELVQDLSALAQVFSGNHILPGSEPIAIVYAGHQFGTFVPRLGDGRAHLLGEVLDQSGRRWDIQLKGSGRTSFSRGGDGRCPLGPAVREFIMSEAMKFLGVPTTRCLAVVTTGETVFRETALPGGVVTRVASSHLRIGTFQYFAAQGDQQALETLCRYSMARHYPELQEEGDTPYIQFMKKVMERQIHLVVEWMRVGFIHGVMNTDNTTITGETIDYGPCAMMGIYDPKTVYSSIDTMGRYAFGNQPEILQWNMARFAECLLPLINADTHKAVEAVRPVIEEAFPALFEKEYMNMMGKKLGFTSFREEDRKLIDTFLKQLKDGRLDYTVTFDLLTRSLTSEPAASRMKDELGDCFDLWQKRLRMQTDVSQKVQKLMREHNPVVIPRNHHVEEVIQACLETGNATSAERFLQVLRSPYKELAQTSEYQDPPGDGDKDYRTFCGT
ncbi:MAG: YdiU family protein [Deltaproteobacteria bacterium]|nr:YdiU family protein [Deltaproteobacteria bacterium]